mmetsp:Transcript_23499/g.65370  ORF Transcript_23499/g.65370 Transcript_23499/m.65370 type:complete len:825 (+) Transcript_23499:60-2534(+)
MTARRNRRNSSSGEGHNVIKDDSVDFEASSSSSFANRARMKKRRRSSPNAGGQRTRQLGPRRRLLVNMLEFQHLAERDNSSFVELMEQLGMNDRNKKWREEWRNLIDEGVLEAEESRTKSTVYTTGFRLSEYGVKIAYQAQELGDDATVAAPPNKTEAMASAQVRESRVAVAHIRQPVKNKNAKEDDSSTEDEDSPADTDDEDTARDSEEDDPNDVDDADEKKEHQPPIELQPSAAGGTGMGIILPPTNPRGNNKTAIDFIQKIGTKIMPQYTTQKYFYDTVMKNDEEDATTQKTAPSSQRNSQGFTRQSSHGSAASSTTSTTETQVAKDESVRMIQAHRYEIFFHKAANKGSKSFDNLLRRKKMDPVLTKSSIIEYAVQQAQKDPRLQNGNYRFGNFSLITSYGKVEAQAPHVDLLEPNYQFGLLLTSGPGTDWYDTKTKITSVDDLVEAWKRTDEMDREFAASKPSIDPNGDPIAATMETEPLPDSVVQAMRQSKDVKALLEGYGDALLPDEELEKARVAQNHLPAGTLLSLPGSVVHAGPKTDNFRCVLFFSAWPTDSKKAAEYDPDTQYGSVFLCGRIVQLLWRQVGMDEVGRRYMLKKLYRYIRQGGSTPQKKRIKRNWAPHFIYDSLTGFIDQMEQDNSNVARDLNYIAMTAQNEKLTFFNVLGSPDGVLRGDFIRASVENLVCLWDDGGEDDRGPFEVIAYVRPLDKKVLLYYPRDNSETGMSWEGTDPGRDYVLVRETSEGGLNTNNIEEENWFDGTNGKVFDADGDEIRCFVKGSNDDGKKSSETTSSNKDTNRNDGHRPDATEAPNKKGKYYLF